MIKASLDLSKGKKGNQHFTKHDLESQGGPLSPHLSGRGHAADKERVPMQYCKDSGHSLCCNATSTDRRVPA